MYRCIPTRSEVAKVASLEGTCRARNRRSFASASACPVERMDTPAFLLLPYEVFLLRTMKTTRIPSSSYSSFDTKRRTHSLSSIKERVNHCGSSSSLGHVVGSRRDVFQAFADMLSIVRTPASSSIVPLSNKRRCSIVATPFARSKTIAATRRSTVMVLTESMELELGSRAPNFDLMEPRTGERVSLQDFEGAPAILVMFICNHCPFVKMLKDEIKRVTDEYMAKGLSVVAISSNSPELKPLDSPEEMAKDCEEFGYNFPYLFDATQEVAKAYKAACTPEFFIFSKSGRRPFQLEYHGQFDDARPSNDVKPTGKDLRMALDCVLSGRKVDFTQKPSIGCNIKWAPGNEPEYFQSG